jgi:hypothetical protein
VIDEHLQIVQAAEDVLGMLQRSKLRRERCRSPATPRRGVFGSRRRGGRRLNRQLESVAKLLERNPHRVQSVGQVKRTGVLDRAAQRRRPAGDPRLESPAPRPRRRTIFDPAGDLLELGGNALELAGGKLCSQTRACAGTGFRDRRADALQNARVVLASFMQLVYEHGQDIEFPDGAEPARHNSEPVAELANDRWIELQDGQNLAEAARRDARAMERPCVALVEAVQHPPKLFKSCV